MYIIAFEELKYNIGLNSLNLNGTIIHEFYL